MMTPHIAQRSVQEFMTFYLHILITDSPRYFDGGEAVKQTTSSPLAKTTNNNDRAYLLHSLQSVRNSFINPVISLNDALQLAANGQVC